MAADPLASHPAPAGGQVRNVLFVMCDQLRRDYLGCYGHPWIRTPNIDALAARGLRFTRCYAQGPVCGPSRMSAYTGRYVASHGCTWNFVPIGVHLPTMGEHLRRAGLRTAVVGKTHAVADRDGIARLQLDAARPETVLLAEGGFEPYARHDGVVLDAALRNGRVYPYNEFLRGIGYPGPNAWHDHANSAAGEGGELLSGWQMRHSPRPARIVEAHSETAWATDRAMDFIREQGDRPWCLHLSYIKPHWPYMAPAPYHSMYGPDHVVAPVRADHEREHAHPVVRAFQDHTESRAFARDEVRRAVVPTYMGLISQVDAHIGRLMAFLQAQQRLQDTLIVFTSDHGDLLGDHWLGEKEMFHEASAGVPLIVVAPQGARAGEVDDAPTQLIDLLPTFLDAVGVRAQSPWLEGQSLWDRLHDGAAPVRDAAVSELDYAFYPARTALGRSANDARAEMVCTPRWKYVDFQGFEPQLFDLQEDPDELHDLGRDASCSGVRREMRERLREWRRTLRHRTSMTDAAVDGWLRHRSEPGGVRIGEW
jgi:arylsulfatase A-like enzyme